MEAEPQPQSLPLTSPNVSSPTPKRDQHDAEGIGLLAVVTRHGGKASPSEEQGGDPDGHVDKEDPPPAGRDEQAAGHRAERRGQPSGCRPRSDGSLAMLGVVGREDQPSDVGVSNAAPAAWTSRKAISIPTLDEAAQAAEAAVKMATPSRKPWSRR